MLLHNPPALSNCGHSYVFYCISESPTPAVAEQSGSYSADSSGSLYFNSIKNFALLTREEEQFYARRLRNGEAQARETMMLSNQRLVISQARLFRGRGMSLLDLIAEGNLGLLQAVDQFDPEQGVKFSTYAVPWVRHTIRRALYKQQYSVRIPYRVSAQIRRLKRIQCHQGKLDTSLLDLSHELALEPTAQHRLESGLALSRVSFEDVQNWDVDNLQLNAQHSPFASPHGKAVEQDRCKVVGRLLSSLPDSERMIIRLRFGLDGAREHNLDEVAQLLGQSRETVRRRQIQILARLKQALEQQGVDAAVLFRTDLQ